MTASPARRLVPLRRANGPPRSWFLADKLAIPRPAFPVLARPRLNALLDSGTRHRATLVCGPAGAGKTVAVASWAIGRPGGHAVAWLTLDRADNRPPRFWSSVVAALEGALPGSALPAPPEPYEAPGEDFLVGLAEAAAASPVPCVLVLDDVHELGNPDILGSLGTLVHHAPPSLRLVLAGRRPPRLRLARLRVCGELSEIGRADLACTSGETEDYLRMLGLSLDPAERRELHRRTEGWMAGLRMAVLRTSGPPPAGPGGLRGDDPIVADYLRDEVLSRYPPDVRRFLRHTSVVERLTGALADVLTRAGGGARTLDRLSEENALVERDGDSWFRYHPLLRELLLAELRRDGPARIPVLMARAARWHAEQGSAAEALRCAAGARDGNLTARILAAEDVRILVTHGAGGLESALRRVPAHRVHSDAAVAAAWAAARLWAADPEGAAAYAESAETSLDRADRQTRRVLAPKLAALRLLGAGDAGPWTDPAADRGTVSEAEHRMRGLLSFALGLTHLRDGELEPARRELAAADRRLSAGDLPELWFRARAWYALVEAWRGGLRAAEEAAEAVRGAALDAGTALRPTLGAAADLAGLALAHVRLERDDGSAAGPPVSSPTTAWQVPGEPSLVAVAELTGIRALIASGDTSRASAALHRLREASDATHPVPHVPADALAFEIALRTADLHRARCLVSSIRTCHTGFARAALGRLLLAEDDPQGALAAVADLVGEPEPSEGRGDEPAPAGEATPRDQIVALLVAAAAHRRLRTGGQAARALERALALARPEHACRPFLEGGEPVRALLTVLVPPNSPNAGFCRRVLHGFDARRYTGGTGTDDGTRPLTGGELAVVRFLPSHMTNEEIAEALFLSVNTVKTHLRSAYRKLGVGSRRAAIAEATRRRLL